MNPAEAAVRGFLRERDVTDAEIDAAVAEETLPLLVIDRILFAGAPRYDEEQLLAAVGADKEFARALWRAMGFPLVQEGDVAFFEEDRAALELALPALGLPADDVAVTQTRNFGAAMTRVAEQIVDTFALMLRELRAAGTDEWSIAYSFLTTFHADVVDRLLAYVFRRQFHAVMWRRLAEPTGLDAGPDLAVGFVDLVRYAAITENVADDELERIVVRFEGVAHDAITGGGGRLVKMIGDAVMFVADDPAAATDVALRLVDAYAHDELLPPARAGLAWGPALERGGDYFGPVVNLASRIVDVARPSRVVASADLKTALDTTGRFAFRRLPPKRLRGLGLHVLWAVARG